MPAEYLAIKNICLKDKKEKNEEVTEQDKKDCAKMAAIIYFKKYGKPVKEPVESKFSFEISDLIDKENETIMDLVKSETISLKENIASIEINSKLIISKIKDQELLEAGVIFNQPFEKKDVNYRYSPPPNEDYCGLCAHYIGGYHSNVCHLVKGLVEMDNVCDHWTFSLMSDSENEKIMEERKKEEMKEHLMEINSSLNFDQNKFDETYSKIKKKKEKKNLKENKEKWSY